jgi:hypothetical protein
MEPISGLGQLMRVLQQRLAGSRRQPAPAAADSDAPPRLASTRPKAAAQEVERRIRERIARLDPAEQRGQEAIRIFVSSVLAWEFGEEILGDPEFSALSRQVEEALAAEPELLHQFQHWAGRS